MFCTMMEQKMARERMVASADKKVSFGKEILAYSSIRQCTAQADDLYVRGRLGDTAFG